MISEAERRAAITKLREPWTCDDCGWGAGFGSLRPDVACPYCSGLRVHPVNPPAHLERENSELRAALDKANDPTADHPKLYRGRVSA